MPCALREKLRTMLRRPFTTVSKHYKYLPNKLLLKNGQWPQAIWQTCTVIGLKVGVGITSSQLFFIMSNHSKYLIRRVLQRIGRIFSTIWPLPTWPGLKEQKQKT